MKAVSKNEAQLDFARDNPGMVWVTEHKKGSYYIHPFLVGTRSFTAGYASIDQGPASRRRFFLTFFVKEIEFEVNLTRKEASTLVAELSQELERK